MKVVAGLLAFVLPGVLQAQSSEFHLTNERWTYREGNWAIGGILVKPEGKGPFPAILISHGKGSNAAAFASSKAREFAQWGIVSIAVDYTHAGGGEPGSDGASKENIRRALKCLEILRDQPYVDGNRIAAYGNSMGAFLTIGLAAEPKAKLKAAIITAGGISGQAGFPAPTSEVAKKIKVPFLILHGEDDQVVPAGRSEELKQVLDENKAENERKLYPGKGHDIHRSEEADVYAQIKAWLVRFKVLGSKS